MLWLATTSCPVCVNHTSWMLEQITLGEWAPALGLEPLHRRSTPCRIFRIVSFNNVAKAKKNPRTIKIVTRSKINWKIKRCCNCVKIHYRENKQLGFAMAETSALGWMAIVHPSPCLLWFFHSSIAHCFMEVQSATFRSECEDPPIPWYKHHEGSFASAQTSEKFSVSSRTCDSWY